MLLTKLVTGVVTTPLWSALGMEALKYLHPIKILEYKILNSSKLMDRFDYLTNVFKYADVTNIIIKLQEGAYK